MKPFSILFSRLLVVVCLCLLSLDKLPAPTRAQTTNSIACVSAANYLSYHITFNSIVAAFGKQLATTTVAATNIEPLGPRVVLPTTLGGTTVRVAGILAPLFFVSPTQVNFSVPPELTNANLATDRSAVVEIRAGNGVVSTGRITVARFAPALFTFDGTGRGVPAGVTVRVKPGDVQEIQPLADYDSNARAWKQRPIDLGGANDRMFLVLFASGVRNATDPNQDGNVNETVRVLLNNIEVVPYYVGAQPSLTGLDQLNIEIPRGLYGKSQLQLSIISQETGNLQHIVANLTLRIPDIPQNTLWVSRGLNNQSVQHIAALGTSIFAATPEKIYRSIDRGVEWKEALYNGESIYDTSLFWGIPGQFLAAAVKGNQMLVTRGDEFTYFFVNTVFHGLNTRINAVTTMGYYGTEFGLFRIEGNPGAPPTPMGPAWFWKVISPFENIPIRASAGNLLGTQNNGLYRMTSLGVWQKVTQGIATNASITKLAIWDQYAYAAWENNGFHRSTNEGVSWQPVSVPWPNSDKITAIAPYGHNVAVTTLNNGVFMSNDYGATWRAINTGLNNLHVLSAVLDDSRFMVGTENGFYVASNYLGGYGGVIQIPVSRPLSFTTDEETPKNISLATGYPASYRYLVMSKPGAGTLTGTPPNLTYTPNPNFYGTDAFFYSVNDGLLLSQNNRVEITVNNINDPPTLGLKDISSPIVNGQINARLSQFLSFSLRAEDIDGETPVVTVEPPPAGISLSFDSGNDFIFNATQVGQYQLTFVATDRGGLKSSLTVNLNVTDNPEKKTWVARDFETRQAPTDLLISGDVILVGVGSYTFGFNDGVMRSTNGGATWNLITTGLPTRNAVEALAQSGNAILASGQFNGIYRSTDTGLTWSESNGNISPETLRGARLEASGDRVLSANSNGVFLSTDRGISWKQLNLGIELPPSVFYTIAITNTHLFVSISERGLYRSADNGMTWTPIHQAIGTNVTTVDPLEVVGTSLYVGANGLTYRSNDQGTTWTAFATPNGRPARNFLAVGNDLFCLGLGVWVQRNNSGIWLPMNQGFTSPPNVKGFLANGTQLYLLDVGGLYTRPIVQ